MAILLLELEEDGAGGTSADTNRSGGGFSCGAGEYRIAQGAINGKTLTTSQYNTSISGSYFETYKAFEDKISTNGGPGLGGIGKIRRWRNKKR